MRSLHLLAFSTLIGLSGCDKIKENLPFLQEKSQTATSSASSTVKNYEFETLGNKVNTIKNPCLDPELINGVKKGILDKAGEVLKNKAGGDIDSSVYNNIQTTEIKFDNISQAQDKDGKPICNALAYVTYKGNTDSMPKTVEALVKFQNTKIQPSTNSFINAYSGYDLQRQIQSFGVNEFNVDGFSEVHENSFRSDISYKATESMSETGQSRTGWQALWGHLPNMIATISYFDWQIQKLQKQGQENAQRREQEKVKQQAEAEKAKAVRAEQIAVDTAVAQKQEAERAKQQADKQQEEKLAEQKAKREAMARKNAQRHDEPTDETPSNDKSSDADKLAQEATDNSGSPSSDYVGKKHN